MRGTLHLSTDIRPVHTVTKGAMPDSTDDYLAVLQALLKESEAARQRAEETIRRSEETLRLAKAVLEMLPDKLPGRRIA